ncbi:MAG: hypothetical protein E7293_10950 [Lachnospiraceae bacterium]|nr:hypothetical protein [Lachnospiraceae bacterium]
MKKESGRKTGRGKWLLLVPALFVFLVVGAFAWKWQTEGDYAGEGIVCQRISPITWEERVEQEYLERYQDCLTDLEDGDILLTSCSHTLGWRNGHAAIVVDAEKELTLEAVMPGSVSCIQSVAKWRGYPGVMVLRLKGVSAGERSRIADYAREQMTGTEYGFTGDLVEHFFGMEAQNTHCAHLIRETYLVFGYDLDGDGGIFVTPRDISISPLLEVVESYNVKGW